MMRFAVAMVALAALAGCAHHRVRDPATPAPASPVDMLPTMLEACTRVTSVTVDSEFDAREIAAIGRGLEAWERGTGRRECFLPGSWLTANLRFVRYWTRKDFDTFHHLKDWSTVIGLWSANDSAIYIAHEPSATDGQLGALMAHELGHFLSLDHYRGVLPSVMEPMLFDQAPLLDGGSIPERDLRSYCANHDGCDK